VFDLAAQIELHRVDFRLFPELWDKFCCDGIDLNTVMWKEIKFLSNDGTTLNDEMSSLPSDKGGIYIFYAKCNVLPGISNYLMYIGRAKITENHSLKVRCRKYFYEYTDDNGRPKIRRLVNQWGRYLFIKYIELDDNNLIDKLEAGLINSILPPFNDTIPEKKIRDAVKAFN
jgi:hypothetical protein